MALSRIEEAPQEPDGIPGTEKHHGGTKLHNLQVLRAIAAFSVVVAHCIHETLNLPAATQQPAGAEAWNLGYGVDIFFVLSGFIMMHTAAREFGKKGASLRFFLRRCARVIPLYWLLTSVLLLGSIFAPSLLSVPIGDISHVVSSYLFIPDGRGMGEIRPVLALGWTLNYEMLFYVLFALALTMPIRPGVIWLASLMAILALAGTMIDPHYVQIAFWTRPIILEFLYGVFIALIFRSGLRVGIGVALGLGAFGLLGFIRLPIAGDDATLPEFLRCGLPAAAFVLAAAIGPALPSRRIVLWAVALGDASYSLYLVHPFLVKPMRALWVKVVGDHLPSGLLVVCSALFSVLFALALYRFVEKPLTAGAQSLAYAFSGDAEKGPSLPRPRDAERS